MAFSINPTPGTLKHVIAAGDSITAAAGGWRPFFQVIQRSANKRLDWMGTQSSGQPFLDQPLHMGFSGFWIDKIATEMANFSPPNTPDLIFCHVGTNDLLYATDFGGTAGTLANMTTRHTTFINQLFTRWPSVILVCVRIGQYFGDYGTGATDIAPGDPGGPKGDLMARLTTSGFNTYISALPGSHAKGSQIKVADCNAAINDSTLCFDGLHPRFAQGLTLTARAIWLAARSSL